MADKLMEYKALVPLLSNRFIIEAGNIGKEKFDTFNIRFTDNSLKLYLKIRNFELDLTSPNELFDIKKVKINFLNPVGETIEVLDLLVDLDVFEIKGDYNDNEILCYECTFEVRDLSTLKSLAEEKKMVENYLKRKNEEENKKEDK